MFPHISSAGDDAHMEDHRPRPLMPELSYEYDVRHRLPTSMHQKDKGPRWVYVCVWVFFTSLVLSVWCCMGVCSHILKKDLKIRT